MSFSEDLAYESLRLVLYNGVEIKRNYRPDWLTNPRTGHRLEYDFYLTEAKVAIEIQGPHHYDSEDQIRRDTLKAELSKQAGVTLFAISIFQIGPFSLFGKLTAFTNRTGVFVGLRTPKENRDSWERQADRVAEYKAAIKRLHGDEHPCHLPPGSASTIARKAAANEFLRYNTQFDVKYQGGTTRVCFVRELDDDHILVRMLSKPGHTFSVRKLRVILETPAKSHRQAHQKSLDW